MKRFLEIQQCLPTERLTRLSNDFARVGDSAPFSGTPGEEWGGDESDISNLRFEISDQCTHAIRPLDWWRSGKLTKCRIIVVVIALLPIASLSRAEEPRPTLPHGLLEQMSRETQGLYEDVQGGIVRLQLPPPRWLNEVAARDNPVDKWGGQLAAQVKEKLEQDRKSAQQGKYNVVKAQVTSTTQPRGELTQAAPKPASDSAWRLTQDAGGNTIVLESTGAGTPSTLQIQTGGEVRDGQVVVGGAPQITLQSAMTFAPNNVGLIYDDEGHVLVPLYLERETIGDGVRASIGEGPVAMATFVASDRQSNVTVLKLASHSGKPVKLGPARPADGALVLLLAPNSGSGKLLLWTGGQRDVAGVVVGVDGAVDGFARYGQFLCAGTCKPVVEQLVRTGKVKRAVLGVMVREVPRSDAAREQLAALGNQPALRVEEVRAGSAAERGGLKAGDLILSVAGEPVGDPASFAAVIANRSGKTSMRLIRSGEVVEVGVELKAE